MRVITAGRFSSATTPDKAPWWVGRRGQCAVCGAVLELAATDAPEREPGVPVDESVRVVFTCPEPHQGAKGAVVVWRYGGGGM
jgi:hypothetical protein